MKKNMKKITIICLFAKESTRSVVDVGKSNYYLNSIRMGKKDIGQTARIATSWWGKVVKKMFV